MEYESSQTISLIALYDYQKIEDDELCFKKGDIITLLEKYEDSDWWKGKIGDQVGLFPNNYAKVCTEITTSESREFNGLSPSLREKQNSNDSMVRVSLDEDNPTSPNYVSKNNSSTDRPLSPGSQRNPRQKILGGLKVVRERGIAASEIVRTKASETNKKLHESKFMANAKERANTAATYTKTAVSKAGTQTKVAAQRARNQWQKSKDSPHMNDSYKPLPPEPPNPETQIFGVPLAEAVKKSSRINPNCPDIVIKCITYLNDKISEEGLFRLSGSAQQIQELKRCFDKGLDVDLSIVRDEHVVTGLLKLYFRELPKNLFYEARHELEKLDGISDPQKVRAILACAADSMPLINRTILDLLMGLLNRVANQSEKNKMTVSNLAIVFSPTLNISLEIVRGFILDYDHIFHHSLIDLQIRNYSSSFSTNECNLDCFECKRKG